MTEIYCSQGFYDEHKEELKNKNVKIVSWLPINGIDCNIAFINEEAIKRVIFS